MKFQKIRIVKIDSHKVIGINQKISNLEELKLVSVLLQGLCKCFSCISFSEVIPRILVYNVKS